MVSFESSIDLSPLYDFIDSAEQAQGVVYYSMPYALYIELPTDYDDKKPPLDPIREWVKRNIQIDFEGGETIDSVSFAVQNAIYENGSEGVFFASNTLDDYKGGRWEDIANQYRDSSNISNLPEELVEELLDDMLADTQNNIVQADKIDTGNLLDSGIYIMHVDPESFAIEQIEVNR